MRSFGQIKKRLFRPAKNKVPVSMAIEKRRTRARLFSQTLLHTMGTARVKCVKETEDGKTRGASKEIIFELNGFNGHFKILI